MSVLLIAELNNGELDAATTKIVSAARQIEDDVHVLVAGHNCEDAADQAARLDGVAKVLHADAPHLDHQIAEEMAALVVPMMDSYDTAIAAATSSGKNIMPRVAALLDVGQVSDITAVHGPDTFERPIYAGNALQTVQTTDPKKIVTVRTTAFPDSGKRDEPAPVEAVTVPEPVGLSTFVDQQLTASDRPDLSSAKIVVSGGRGMQSGDNFKMLERLADKLGAAIGASRAAVDAGYVPNDYQVGQTGKVIAPDLYIAVGISGAIQHLAGMKESKVIVAINKDPEAPIFQVADYGLVADLFEAIPEIERELDRELAPGE
jgi:electron transfer flavoprotein alpha subunit